MCAPRPTSSPKRSFTITTLIWASLTFMGCDDDSDQQNTSEMTTSSGSEMDASVTQAGEEMVEAETSSPISSTYEALQVKLFEAQGCTDSACHGVESAGGLNLTAEVSYDQLVEVEQVETVSPHNSSSCHCNFVKGTECAAAIAGCAVACGVTGGAACVACLDIIPGCCNCACKAFGCDCAKDC